MKDGSPLCDFVEPNGLAVNQTMSNRVSRGYSLFSMLLISEHDKCTQRFDTQRLYLRIFDVVNTSLTR